MGQRSKSRRTYNKPRSKKGRRAFKNKTKKRGRTSRVLRRRRMRGGIAPFSSSNDTGGYAQYQNNYPVSTQYSTGGVLPPAQSALANPTPYSKLTNAAIDNLNHFAKNSFGKSDSGMGFPSRGWY